MNRLSTILCALVLAALPSASALADTVYTYTGNHYTYADGPFNTTESIQGSFTLTSPLAPNTAYHRITPTQFTFSDGQTAITNANNSGSYFAVSTNAIGDISIWDISIALDTSTTAELFSSQYTPSAGVVDLTDYTHLTALGFVTSFGENLNDPGTWTTSTTDAPVAEPSSLLMLLTGAIGSLGTLRSKL